MTFQGTRHRRICLRCQGHFASVVKFSQHLGECDTPFDVDFIMSLLEVDRSDDCWLMNDPRGAKYVPKFGTAPGKVTKVHEIVAVAAHGRRPEGMMLCHSCDNRKCLRPSHLYWGTAQQNSEDAWRNGRRTMSPEQLTAMHLGLRASEKNKERMLHHNRELAKKHSGDAHWTRRNPEAMKRWIDATRQGREKARLARAEGGDA